MICDHDPEDDWDSREAMYGSLYSLYADGTAVDVDVELVDAMNRQYLLDYPPTPEEQPYLVANVADMLRTGWWGGLREDEYGREVRAAAGEFMANLKAGLDPLTAEFIKLYAWDLAGELRLGRGWCIHSPEDKHPYFEGMCASPEEMRLILSGQVLERKGATNGQ